MRSKNVYFFILRLIAFVCFASPLLAMQRGSWILLKSVPDKVMYADDLIKLVQNAYRSTLVGSYVNRQEDVLASDWYAIRCEKSSVINAAIFFRSARPDEPWQGYKIQGAGHDGSNAAKELVVNKRKELARQKGWWMEAAGAVEHILYKDPTIPFISDQETARRIFPSADLKMTGEKGRYIRIVPGLKGVPQTIFGTPLLKKA